MQIKASDQEYQQLKQSLAETQQKLIEAKKSEKEAIEKLKIIEQRVLEGNQQELVKPGRKGCNTLQMANMYRTDTMSSS